jgi:hypothetical protein
MSVRCHFQTHAPQQIAFFDHLIGVEDTKRAACIGNPPLCGHRRRLFVRLIDSQHVGQTAPGECGDEDYVNLFLYLLAMSNEFAPSLLMQPSMFGARFPLCEEPDDTGALMRERERIT